MNETSCLIRGFRYVSSAHSQNTPRMVISIPLTDKTIKYTCSNSIPASLFELAINTTTAGAELSRAVVPYLVRDRIDRVAELVTSSPRPFSSVSVEFRSDMQQVPSHRYCLIAIRTNVMRCAITLNQYWGARRRGPERVMFSSDLFAWGNGIA